MRAQIQHLRDDIIRVRWWAGDQEPAARHSYAVIRQGRPADNCLRTPFMLASLDQATQALHITAADGTVLFETPPALPPAFDALGFALHRVIGESELFFGLGDKTGPLARNDQAFSLWNTDRVGFEESTDPIYKSIPVVLIPGATASVLLLLDSTARSFFDFGKRYRDVLTFGADAAVADLYVIVGATPKDVLRGNAWLTGAPARLPLWALGHQLSRYSYMTDAEVRGVANGLRGHSFPADALYLDIDYQDRFRTFTTDPERFPDLPALVRDLRASGLRTVAITDAPLPVAEDYAPYVAGLAGDHFIRDASGTVFTGKMWGGPSAFPDFARAATREWWGSLYAAFVRAGIAGFWDDMNEPTVFGGPAGTLPLSAQHRVEEPGETPRMATHAELHNVYGLLNAQATFEGVARLSPDMRPFVLTRAASAGAQRYATTWTGDNTATWNHLRIAVAQLLNLGLSGFPFAGADLGGFFGSPPPALLTRWYQIGAWTPLFRNHCFQGMARREPWVDGEPHTSLRRAAVETRYRLLPYFYTLAEKAWRTGVPMMRPMFLEFPQVLAQRPWFLRDARTQFMVGSAMCVAPPPYAEFTDSYEAVLPGAWFDYWTGAPISQQKPGRLTIAPDPACVPVFVRAGAIVPHQPLVQSTMEQLSGALQLHVYPGPRLAGKVYVDAGDGHGPWHLLRIEGEMADGAITLRFAREGDFVPWWQEFELVVHGQGRATRHRCAPDVSAARVKPP